MKVVYHRLAARDVRQILDYYEGEAGSLLADRFFHDLLETITIALLDPQHFPPLDERFRRAISWASEMASALGCILQFRIFSLSNSSSQPCGRKRVDRAVLVAMTKFAVSQQALWNSSHGWKSIAGKFRGLELVIGWHDQRGAASSAV